MHSVLRVEPSIWAVRFLSRSQAGTLEGPLPPLDQLLLEGVAPLEEGQPVGPLVLAMEAMLEAMVPGLALAA